MQASTRIWRNFDIWLLAAVAVITIAGIAMIQSAIAGNESLAETVPRQTIYAVIGLVVTVATTAIDYRIWSALSRPLYIVTCVLLALIPLAGIVGFGSARWFNVGIVNIQPSELAKILMILIVADYLARHKNEIHRPRIIVRSLLLIAPPALLIITQPDLSTAIVIGVIWLALIWAVGVPLKHLAKLLGVMLAIILFITPFLAPYFLNEYPQENDFKLFNRYTIMKYYQMQRLVSFFLPDPEAQYGETYNVNQALITIGSGGWFGQGYGQGTQVQLRFLKVRHTDFIFSVMAHEFGFVGATVVLLLLMFIIYRCLNAARMARDTFGSLICYGVAIIIFFQGAFNIGVNLNLFPVSGLPMPFFSYGGSSLLTNLIGIGLVESVILRHKQIQL
jgi:rod shape determining protein RodA